MNNDLKIAITVTVAVIMLASILKMDIRIARVEVDKGMVLQGKIQSAINDLMACRSHRRAAMQEAENYCQPFQTLADQTRKERLEWEVARDQARFNRIQARAKNHVPEWERRREATIAATR